MIICYIMITKKFLLSIWKVHSINDNWLHNDNKKIHTAEMLWAWYLITKKFLLSIWKVHSINDNMLHNESKKIHTAEMLWAWYLRGTYLVWILICLPVTFINIFLLLRLFRRMLIKLPSKSLHNYLSQSCYLFIENYVTCTGWRVFFL